MALHKVNDQSRASHYPSHYPQGATDCAFITKQVEILVQIARSIVDSNRRWSCCIWAISFNKWSCFNRTYARKEDQNLLVRQCLEL